MRCIADAFSKSLAYRSRRQGEILLATGLQERASSRLGVPGGWVKLAITEYIPGGRQRLNPHVVVSMPPEPRTEPPAFIHTALPAPESTPDSEYRRNHGHTKSVNTTTRWLPQQSLRAPCPRLDLYGGNDDVQCIALTPGGNNSYRQQLPLRLQEYGCVGSYARR